MDGWLLFVCGILCILSTVEGEQCAVSEDAVAECSAVDLGEHEKIQAVIIVNLCHTPSDVLFTLKSRRNKWRWSHTFINTDEEQKVRGPDVNAILRVRIQRPDNQTLQVWANFIVEGKPFATFFNHSFVLDFDAEACVPVSHETSLKDLLALLIFCALCVLITVTATISLLCLRHRKCRHCRCCACPISNPSLSSCKLLSSANSDRPLSSSSLHSSSHGSYEDPDENFFASRLRKTRPNHRHPRKTKSMAIVRNSVYSDSIAMEELPAISEGMPHFGSLGRNFRSKKAVAAPHWIPAQEEEYLSDLSLDSHGQVPAQDLLNLEAGTSQPHYSATKFHSFRAKKSASGRRKNPPPQDDPVLTPESPLLSPKEKCMMGNGKVKEAVKNGGLKRGGEEDKRLSAQHLLNAEMHHSDSFY